MDDKIQCSKCETDTQEVTRARKTGFVLIGLLLPLIGIIISLVSFQKYKKNGYAPNKIVGKYSLVSSLLSIGVLLIICIVGAGSSPEKSAVAKTPTNISKQIKAKSIPPKTVNSQVKKVLSSDPSYSEFSVKAVDDGKADGAVLISLQDKKTIDTDWLVMETGEIHTSFCENIFKQFPKIDEITTSVDIIGIDSYGNEQMVPGITITWNREINNKINYTNFKDMSSYQPYKIARAYSVDYIVWRDFKDKSDLNNKNVREY